jgi:hypothetical protein
LVLAKLIQFFPWIISLKYPNKSSVRELKFRKEKVTISDREIDLMNREIPLDTKSEKDRLKK